MARFSISPRTVSGMKEAILSHPLFAGLFVSSGMIAYNCIRAAWRHDATELRHVWFWVLYVPTAFACYWVWQNVDFCLVIK